MSEPVRFPWDQLLRFRAASQDANPLHTDPDYAARTHFGEPVVFGVLAGLGALARVPQPTGCVLTGLDLSFRAAAFPDEDYEVHVTQGRESIVAELKDGPRLLTRATARFGPGAPHPTPGHEHHSASRVTPRRGPAPPVGTVVSGAYSPSWDALRAIADEVGLPLQGVTPVHLAVAAFASYLVGMELPGECALFNRLSIRFPQGLSSPPGPWTYRARVERTDARFALSWSSFTLETAAGVLATGEVSSFERLSIDETIRPLIPHDPPRLADARALVIGASRGLGAAFARGLALDGVRVTGTYRRDTEGAAGISAAVPHGAPPVRMLQGDAADPESCTDTLRQLTAADGGLDLLICNASPPLRPRAFTAASLDQFHASVSASIALVTAPVAAALPSIERSGGTIVLISSVAVEAPPAEWAHYVAAKRALEGLFHTLAAAHRGVRFIILRPPRMRTGFTHNPTLHEALPPSAVVETLILALGAPWTPGAAACLREFPPPAS